MFWLTDPLNTLFILTISVAFVGVSIVWRHRRYMMLLRRWAQEHDFKLVEYQCRWIDYGPFKFHKGRMQAVYRIEVIDSLGEVRMGYVRLGGWFWGSLSNAVVVEWEKPGFPVIMSDSTQKRDELKS